MLGTGKILWERLTQKMHKCGGSERGAGAKLPRMLKPCTNTKDTRSQTWTQQELIPHFTRLNAKTVTITNAKDGSQVTIAGFRSNTCPEFASISLARK